MCGSSVPYYPTNEILSLNIFSSESQVNQLSTNGNTKKASVQTNYITLPDSMLYAEEIRIPIISQKRQILEEESKLEECSFSVSPNPATNIAEFVFTLPTFSTDYSLEIVDMQSKLVHQIPLTSPYLKVDISPLEPGVYICNLKQSDQILETKKLIKK